MQDISDSIIEIMEKLHCDVFVALLILIKEQEDISL